MKKCIILLFALCFVLVGCVPGKDPEPSSSVTPAPSSSVASSVASSAVSEGWTILANWEHTDWQQTEGLIFAWDLDGDGKIEEIRFTAVNDFTTRCTVGEEELILDLAWLDSAVLLDAKRADNAKDLLLSGWTDEANWPVLHYRCLNGKLEKVEEELFSSLSCRDGKLFLSWYVDALGTWGVSCPYTLDAEGKLARASEVLTVELGDGEIYPEQQLKLQRDLPATVDGKAVTVPAGSRLYPVRFAEDLHWVELQLMDEDSIVRVELAFSGDEMDFGVKINGVDESEYFESLPYAG